MQKQHKILNNSIRMVLVSGLFILGTFILQLILEESMKRIGIQSKYICDGISRILVVVIVLILFIKMNKNIVIGFQNQGIKLGLLLGWPIYIAMLINIYDVASMAHIDKVPTLLEWILYIVYVFSIGLYEEVVLRGIVLNKMLEKWGDSKKGIVGAVLLSSLLFGLLHLVNLIGKPWLIVATGTQVVYALFIGVFFAAIYLRTKNLWTVIVLHMFLDLGGCLDELFLEKVTAKTVPDISLGDSVSILAEWVIFLLLGLLYLRKVKGEIKKIK